jgi:hypothetical protein
MAKALRFPVLPASFLVGCCGCSFAPWLSVPPTKVTDQYAGVTWRRERKKDFDISGETGGRCLNRVRRRRSADCITRWRLRDRFGLFQPATTRAETSWHTGTFEPRSLVSGECYEA